MALSFLQKALNILNPFDANTIASSRAAKGGFLNPTPIFGAPDQGYKNTVAPNGVSDYLARRPGAQPQLPPRPAAPAPAPQPTASVSQPRAVARGGTAPGLAGPVSQPSQPQSLGYFMGKEYFDPAQLYQDQLSYLDSVYGTNLATMRQGKQRQLDEYGRQKADISTQLADALAGLNTQETQGLGNIGNYYSNLGDIYQSSQGTRETGLRNDVATARGKVRTQAQTGQSAIERAIADYLGGYGQNESQLANQYQTARDQIANGLVTDLGNGLGVQQAVGANVDTGLTPDQININNDLVTNLQKLQGSRLNNPFAYAGGALNVNPILQYLQGFA